MSRSHRTDIFCIITVNKKRFLSHRGIKHLHQFSMDVPSMSFKTILRITDSNTYSQDHRSVVFQKQL